MDAGPLAAASDALQDGEIVLVSLRPSRWMLGPHLVASLVVVTASLVLGVRGLGGVTSPAGLGQALGLGLVVWLPVAAWFVLDWRSHRYVLTNRRVISSVGMIRPFVGEAPLAAVRRVVLTRGPTGRALGTGTIGFENPHALRLVTWARVSRPQEVRRTVVEALRRYGRSDFECD